jgi:hypothetical protein
MNKRGRSLHSVRSSGSDGHHNVGYGRPPKQNQYQPGQSGNPKGRPKGRKNTATLLREILDRMIEVRNGSTIRKISVREAMLTRFAESALKGDTKISDLSVATLRHGGNRSGARKRRANTRRAGDHRQLFGGISKRKGADK